ncbi:hypothetical protein AAVH_30816, partial [Aphelenchoides avenae]
RFKRNDFTNDYGYGPHGVGPSNGGFDSFGYYKDKFYNSGLPGKYTWATYRNYYEESLQRPQGRLPGFFEVFTKIKGWTSLALWEKFEILQQERFGPFYNGYWGAYDHSPEWFGK